MVRPESQWCARSGFGTHPRYEAPGDLWGRTWNSVVFNIRWVRLPPCQWPNVCLRAVKWLIKRCLKKLYIFFSVFIVVFDKQANIRCSIGSIPRSISSRDHNATDQAIAMNRYQSYFRKRDDFFSGKQQGAVNSA